MRSASTAHALCVDRPVGHVGVSHQHVLGIDRVDGLADRLAFPLPRLSHHSRAGLGGEFAGAIGRPPVDHQDVIQPGLLVGSNHVDDRGRLVEGRQEDTDVRARWHYRGVTSQRIKLCSFSDSSFGVGILT